MFGIILVICEFIIVMAARFWFPGQPFTVSLAAAVTTIVYIHGFRQYLIYIAGNLLSLVSVPVLIKIGKERVRESTMGMLYPIFVLLLMQTGRAAAALLMGAEPGSVIGFYTTDSLSMLFTFVIIWIARRLDGV